MNNSYCCCHSEPTHDEIWEQTEKQILEDNKLVDCIDEIQSLASLTMVCQRAINKDSSFLNCNSVSDVLYFNVYRGLIKVKEDLKKICS